MLCLPSSQYFICNMSPSLLTSSASSVFYSCCNSHLTFPLSDNYIIRPQFPYSLSLLPTSSTISSQTCTCVSPLFKITLITSGKKESTEESGEKWRTEKEEVKDKIFIVYYDAYSVLGWMIRQNSYLSNLLSAMFLPSTVRLQ